ncbi:hypothetical protein AB0L00_03070 [Actinoallomurus sp. NPDC052308]|uniref:hypothetical protein n=1 Tax=Actinoallomurus sp. NPDC052308 TaxID=3155530 RepID=UPI003426F8EA
MRQALGRSSWLAATGVTPKARPENAGGNAFVVQGAAGNVLIDSPRFTAALRGWIQHDLGAEPYMCWCSWTVQVDSLERLSRHAFTRVVPTHGTISPTLEPSDMRQRLQALVTRLRHDLTDE